MRSASPTRISGSSPLARGLPVAVPLHLLRLGIIPARAGFTSTEEIVGADSPGSSPLARGLPHAGQIDRYGRGIIPARAGFTGQGVAVDPLGGDHPRSRGVYETAGSATSHRCGSSPLARGLRLPHAPVPRGFRIIPARAGFTSRPRPRPGGREDHPRSRGVYPPPPPPPREDVGSSPLARGLLGRVHHRRLLRRIIPARAGFTSCMTTCPRSRSDHPRSRGVYGCPRSRAASERGSSPLARGLHSTGAAGRAKSRIIPARAGFTSSTASSPPRAADHPRSRGVYGRH